MTICVKPHLNLKQGLLDGSPNDPQSQVRSQRPLPQYDDEPHQSQHRMRVQGNECLVVMSLHQKHVPCRLVRDSILWYFWGNHQEGEVKNVTNVVLPTFRLFSESP